jgi:hypothetical protein
MGITFSPDCGQDFEPEVEDTERKKDRVRSPRGPGRPKKSGTSVTPELKSGVRSNRIPRFEDFEREG